MNFYKNGNYTVCIMNDGTKIRKTDDNVFMPSFSEGIDVQITLKCQQNCNFCYAGCTPKGRHADILSYNFIDTLHPFTELAFNGNDMDHPQLYDFLVKLKGRKVYANMTVNQEQFMKNIHKIKEYSDSGLIYGIGVSFKRYDERFLEEFKQFPNGVLHVINGIITCEDLNRIKNHGLKILILGYKSVGRGSSYLTEHNNSIAANESCLYKSMNDMIDEKWFKVISFDNLAIEQLDVKQLIPNDKWNEFYMGDDGNFTFYIDMVGRTFSRNSCVIDKKYSIGEKTIDEMFNIIKEEYNNGSTNSK